MSWRHWGLFVETVAQLLTGGPAIVAGEGRQQQSREKVAYPTAVRFKDALWRCSLPDASITVIRNWDQSRVRQTTERIGRGIIRRGKANSCVVSSRIQQSALQLLRLAFNLSDPIALIRR